MGTFSVVLAEAEPAEVVTVATARVPVPVALAGSAATRARGVAEAAGPAPFAALPPCPVCGGPGRQDTESGQGQEEPHNTRPIPDPMRLLQRKVTRPRLGRHCKPPRGEGGLGAQGPAKEMGGTETMWGGEQAMEQGEP